jgi:hypothetical protein
MGTVMSMKFESLIYKGYCRVAMLERIEQWWSDENSVECS